MIRKFLKNELIKRGYKENEIDESVLKEFLENSVIIWKSSEIIINRWFITQYVVCEIDNKFIKYPKIYVTGDYSLFDMGIDYDLDKDCSFVTPKQKEITYYE